jgi:inner membrane protease subunit 2
MFSQWTKRILRWSPVLLVFLDHGYSVARVKGRSMQPTLNPDDNGTTCDIVLLNRHSKQHYQRQDIVTFRSPIDPNRILIKRILAIPNDRVLPLPITQRSIPIRSKPISSTPKDYITIPYGHYWVEGDDSFHSHDSNTFGPIPEGLIESRVVWILWPLSRFGPITSKKIVNNRFQYMNIIQEDKETEMIRSLWPSHHKHLPKDELSIDWETSKFIFLSLI